MYRNLARCLDTEVHILRDLTRHHSEPRLIQLRDLNANDVAFLIIDRTTTVLRSFPEADSDVSYDFGFCCSSIEKISD